MYMQRKSQQGDKAQRVTPHVTDFSNWHTDKLVGQWEWLSVEKEANAGQT